MKKKSLALTLTGLCILVLQNNILAQALSPLPGVEIPNTQVLKLTTAIVGQEYRLDIHLPSNYQRDTVKAYPVIYLLDGQWDFPILTGIYGSQYYDGFLPECIIVGITWAGKDLNIDSLRNRDFTPTRIAEKPQSGGAPKFLTFIKKELIPFIGSKYRVTGDRTLMGSSLSGLFTLYALYTDPSLFHKYALTSPTLSWDNSALRNFEKEYERKGSVTPVRLYMGKGGLEDDLGEFQKFAEGLKGKKVKGLDVHTQILANTGHSGTTAEGFSRGLQYVFKRPSLTPAPAVLERYVGTYQFETVTVYISKVNGKLVATTPGNKSVLQAETEKDFYVKGVFEDVHFKVDNAGKVLGFQLDQFDGSIFIKKMK